MIPLHGCRMEVVLAGTVPNINLIVYLHQSSQVSSNIFEKNLLSNGSQQQALTCLV